MPTEAENLDRQVEELSRVAEKRREQIRKDVVKSTPPDFVLEIMQTEVMYVINPSALPFAMADIAKFSDALDNFYSLKLVDKKQQTHTNPFEVMLNQQHNDVVEFENGRFRTSGQDFIPIKRVRLTTEKVHIILQGDSNAADAILADVVEALWGSTGVTKSWRSLEHHLQLVSYGTGTKVDLGLPLERFIHPTLSTYLDEEWVSSTGYAPHMAPKSRVSNFGVSAGTATSYVMDDLNLLFNIFDLKTGLSTQAKLQFRITAKHEYGTGIYLVVSELPYDLHVQSLQKLKQRFNNG